MTINEIESSFIERRKDRRELCMLHSKELTELHHAIYGNGDLKKGLIWIAEENRLGIAGLQEFVMQFKRNSWKLFWGFFATAAAAFGSFIVQIIKLVITHQ